ncbi:hypothetical protein PV516_19540 [Streptomyces scabiei]|uniref:hypothetical protein n=1 Tax=Streptomyces scabiei TaxID=1930 RepID=UPI0029A53BCD|nr:hypothetical protein [Streptomyces scabiei]MDX3165984.1 hypothetical protein [Streptomyces scabiei]
MHARSEAPSDTGRDRVLRYPARHGSLVQAERIATEPHGDPAVAITTTSHLAQGPIAEVLPNDIGTLAAGLIHLAGEQATERGREVSRALTEARTVLSRAETAIEALHRGPSETLYDADGTKPRWHWPTTPAYDPDHERIVQVLEAVTLLLSPWRRTGQPKGTRDQRDAALQGVTCTCGRRWVGRVGTGHVPTTNPGEAEGSSA